MSERLQRYHKAVEARFARWGDEWYDDFLRNKDWCTVCGESFRLENLSLCTHCDALLGYCHYPTQKAANGNLNVPSVRMARLWGKACRVVRGSLAVAHFQRREK